MGNVTNKKKLKDLPYDIILKILQEFFICKINFCSRDLSSLILREEEKKWYGYFKYYCNKKVSRVEKKLIFHNLFYIGKNIHTFFNLSTNNNNGINFWNSTYFSLGTVEYNMIESFLYGIKIKQKIFYNEGILIFKLKKIRKIKFYELLKEEQITRGLLKKPIRNLNLLENENYSEILKKLKSELNIIKTYTKWNKNKIYYIKLPEKLKMYFLDPNYPVGLTLEFPKTKRSLQFNF
jgi:hypothetical protein